MKPRTTVPASLLRDLKEFAWSAGEPHLAWELLIFDPATSGQRTPLHLASGLVTVSRCLARNERALLKDARSWADDALGPTARPRTGADAAVDLMGTHDSLRELRALQARVWRVLEGLALTVSHGREPGHRSRPGGGPA